jgi:hypothetical protein
MDHSEGKEPSRKDNSSLNRFLGRSRMTYRIPRATETPPTEGCRRYHYQLAKFAELGINICVASGSNKGDLGWEHVARVKSGRKDASKEAKDMAKLGAY